MNCCGERTAHQAAAGSTELGASGDPRRVTDSFTVVRAHLDYAWQGRDVGNLLHCGKEASVLSEDNQAAPMQLANQAAYRRLDNWGNLPVM